MEIDSLESILYCDGDKALEQDSQRLWSLLLWRYTRPTLTQSCATCSRWASFSSRVGLEDFHRSFQSQTFSDSVNYFDFMNQSSYDLLWDGNSALERDQAAPSIKIFNLRLLKNAPDKKKFDEQVLFICVHACVCLYTQDILHTECSLMQKSISTVCETNSFDLRQKDISTDCSLFKLSKYDKIL